ncbi:hypothetical protein [Lentilactobacillus parakefiri]|uniref:GW domain-containing protein n=1 Tax=Lentilactobacillus parakefiri TaxID=152332 RepID=A0A269YPA5_9LACO|nr:hypothetical protein [Lentilactobacillus parakefiri]KRL54407.1 hypothetical protein FD08_GL004323 [Lentilactobacillus parakefiri DSM 10551]PAK87397.1 hypothetical protein B8W98_01010 [Lentilactobacillus parakefiri]PAL00468.1 hypothetical protein B8W96_06575 [Lentilactobacillus parakefiri]TDG90355.1 hypothetical protein C5L28_001559 [Lentilactobacillus parakefiri]GAW71956.1 hypothetical protein LPKJCM_01061 [Lentilactobacillus parakefiri]
MFKKSILLAVTALSFGGFVSITQAPVSNAASMPGSLSYHKANFNAKIGTNYQPFKLTSHVPNSNYKQIKTTSWKKSGLKAGTKIHVDLYASQGLQFNWYRITKFSAKKVTKHAKVQKYWIYGQALNLPKSVTNQLALSY